MLNSPELMEKIRAKFAHVDTCPFTGDRVFFENAGGALTLKSVVETSAKFAAIPDNQGRDNPTSAELGKIISKSKADAAVFFNSRSGQIFVGESGTELLFRMISEACLNAPKGGKVVGSTLEHPASRSAATRWAEKSGRDYVAVLHNDATGTVTVAEYAQVIDADTRVATIIHTSPVTGMSVDVKAIAAAIRAVSPDCFIIVDGIQHAAHGRIDIASYNIDGYAISPYKVFSRHGYGVAWISDRMSVLPHNSLIGGPAENWEMGTRDTGAYAALSDVVAYFDWLGGEVSGETDRRARIEAAGREIHAQELRLTNAMLHGTGNLKGLSEMPRVTVIGGIENPAREGLVSCYVEGVDSADLVARLGDQGVRVHIRKDDHYSGNILKPLGVKDCIRVSMCHYNTEQEVAKFLSAMHAIVV
ncbi:MAG: aminotransferase class V-fold PLP-dependent enzyme [Paracoccaceae bacterium]